MQSAAQRKLSEAEIRRRALRVYQGNADEERLAEIKAAEKKRRAAVRRTKVQLVCSIFSVFLLCMGYMYLNTQVTVTGYEINKQMAANTELQNENTRLILEIEQATSPEKVAGFATEHFNMVTPTEDAVIYYDEARLAQAETPALRTGMTTDAKSLGFGSVEVIEDQDSKGLLGTLGALLGQITSHNTVSLGMSD